MTQKKTSTTMYLTQEQHDALKNISKRTRVPFSVYIREGVDLVIEKYKKHLDSPEVDSD